MLRLAFWNVNRRVLGGLITGLVRQLDSDFLVLAENATPMADLLVQMNEGVERPFSLAPGYNDHLVILSRLPFEYIEAVADIGGLALRHIHSPVGPSVLLAAVHLYSKLFASDADQTQLAVDIAEDIARVETSLGHSRTVIGDLNMNPFEDGVVGSSTLHATNTRTVAKREERVVGGKTKRFFYNPMWSMLGERDGRPSGTYYYDRGRPITYYWNTFDQVLVRPALLGWFSDQDVEIVTRIGATNLLTASGVPNRRLGSDHLPIALTIDHKRLQMSDSQSLWGDLPLDVQIRPPITLLREQATFLTRQTRGLLQGQAGSGTSSTDLMAALDIVAPSLNNYRFRVLTIKHPVTLYPVVVDTPTTRLSLSFAELKRILGSPEIHQVVASLIAQVKASAPETEADEQNN